MKFMAIILLCVSICFATSFIRYSDKKYPPTEHVDVYRTTKIERPYIEIGEIMTGATRRAVMKIIKKAKEVGADAVILLGESHGPMVPLATGGMVQTKRYKAIAIKYIKKQSEDSLKDESDTLNYK